LIYGVSGSFLIKIGNAFFSLLSAVILARLLGVEGFGIYAFCLSIVQLLSIPAMLGSKQLLVREVASYRVKKQFSLLRGLILWFRQASLLVSGFLALAAAGICTFACDDSRFRMPLLIALCVLPLVTRMEIQSAVLRGLRNVLLGQIDQALRPLLLIIIVGSMFWLSGNSLKPENALLAQLFSTGALALLTYIIMQTRIHGKIKKAEPKYEISRWLKSIIPFVFAASMQILIRETSVIALGIFQEPESVGLYRVAQRGSELVPFGLLAVNITIAPTVSELIAKGETQRLQKLINKSFIGILGFALPMALGLILFGKYLIPLTFGKKYVMAYIPMIILCFGQLVSVSVGSVGLILNMSGREHFTAWGVFVAAAVSVLLNITLVPFWGTVGAAIAASSSLIILNIFLFFWLFRETGIISAVNFRIR